MRKLVEYYSHILLNIEYGQFYYEIIIRLEDQLLVELISQLNR